MIHTDSYYEIYGVFWLLTLAPALFLLDIGIKDIDKGKGKARFARYMRYYDRYFLIVMILFVVSCYYSTKV